MASALKPNGKYRGDTPRGSASLAGAIGDVKHAVRGTRDTTVNAKFYKIGCLIGEGELGPHAAQAILEAALAMDDPLDPKVVYEKAGRSIQKGISDAERRVREGFGARPYKDGSGTSYRSVFWRQSETDPSPFGWFR
jgi:hypothetical protein